jgi:hypothetical protein
MSIQSIDFLSALLDQLRHQAGPTGLMIGAEAGNGGAVEIFVKENQITPMRTGLEF